MITHNLIQGSQEWHAYRAAHDNASDAPAMEIPAYHCLEEGAC